MQHNKELLVATWESEPAFPHTHTRRSPSPGVKCEDTLSSPCTRHMTAESPRLGGRVGSPGRPQILELIEERRRVGGWSSVVLFCNQMVVKLPPPPPIPPPSLLFTVNDSSADEAVSGAAGQKHHGEKGLCNWTRRHFFSHVSARRRNVQKYRSHI